MDRVKPRRETFHLLTPALTNYLSVLLSRSSILWTKKEASQQQQQKQSFRYSVIPGEKYINSLMKTSKVMLVLNI